MPKYHTIQNSFTGGEISPRLLGRTDTAQYQNSVKEMVNCYPFIHGGVTRRTGTRHIDTLPSYNSYAPKLIKFVYSRTQSYLLIIHSGKMYFVKDGAFIESGGSKISLTVPYADSELEELRFAQQGNLLILVHANHAPLKLARTSDTVWTLTTISFVHYAVTDAWYRTSSVDVKIYGDGDTATKYTVGQYWQWTTSGSSVTVPPVLKEIGSATNSTPPGGCVVTRVDSSTGNGVWKATCVYSYADREEWQIQAPNGSYPVLQWTTGDYPATVTFYQQRLYFGGTNSSPQTVWGSAISDYENFTIGALDDDAVQFKIASSNYDPVIHLTSAAASVLPLTYSTEYILSGGSASITPHNVIVAPQTYYGTSNVIPLRIGADTVFVQRDGKKLRSIYYDINQSQNLADDLTLFAEHITGNGIVDLAYAQEPDSTLWAVRDDGVLLSITYQRDQSVNAWARHTIDGNAKSVAVVPELDKDNVYVCNERTVNGVTAFYLEELGSELLDSYKTDTTGTAKTTWTGFDHLEGKTVTVLADGFVHPPVTVTSGTVELNDAATDVVVGVGYENYVTLLHPEISANGQTSQGRSVSIDKVVMRFQDTIGCFVETSGTNSANVLPFASFGTKNFAQPTAQYTGDKDINATGWSTNNTLKIGQRDPLDWTLLAVVTRVTVNDM